MGRLGGKVAIVTGGATGIGEAISHKFCLEGARVLVCGLPGDPIDDVVATIRAHGGEALGYAADVAEEAGAAGCVKAAIDAYGKLDVLVANAGVFLVTGETDKISVEDFDRTVRMNCRSLFLTVKHALPHLQQSKGVILAAGSESGMKGLAEYTPYGGTKGFVHAFVQGVAVEQAAHGVRANAVCPGPIDTAWTHASTGPMTKKLEKLTLASTPLGRRGTVEEVANVYAFLASDEATYVTGALWTVDGGITAAKGPVGLQADRALKEPPAGVLHDLRHTHDGLEGKGPHRAH